MHVLNIPVAPGLADRWRDWLAPARQPFFLTAAQADALTLDTDPRADLKLSPEERDTFTVWNVDPAADLVAWPTLGQWDALTPGLRQMLLRIQRRHGRGNIPLGRHHADQLPGLPPSRFLWRRDQLTDAVLARIIADHGQPCQRERVPEAVWEGSAGLLPHARSLAGTFPSGSAGNCFGAVMGAAGVPGAADEWMQREPFEVFLDDSTVPGGADDRPGTLLVWRSADGLVQHAAITLGRSWALHKPSQSWMTPRVVLPVRALKMASRTPGWRLERRALT